jgi:hypothetical protein
MRKVIILGAGDNYALRDSIENSLNNKGQVEVIDVNKLSEEERSQLLKGTDVSALKCIPDVSIIEASLENLYKPVYDNININKQNSQQGWKSDNKYKRRNHR